MILKNKNKTLFILISIYCIGVLLSFSGDLIQQIQDVRYQNQIEKTKKREVLVFSTKEWKYFKNQKEINYKNNFYDVVSHQEVNSKIIATVVKDKFENETRVVISQIFNKHKTPFSEKKKPSSISEHIAQVYPKIAFKPEFLNYKPSNFDVNFDLKIKSFINLLQKPPC